MHHCTCGRVPVHGAIASPSVYCWVYKCTSNCTAMGSQLNPMAHAHRDVLMCMCSLCLHMSRRHHLIHFVSNPPRLHPSSMQWRMMVHTECQMEGATSSSAMDADPILLISLDPSLLISLEKNASSLLIKAWVCLVYMLTLCLLPPHKEVVSRNSSREYIYIWGIFFLIF